MKRGMKMKNVHSFNKTRLQKKQGKAQREIPYSFMNANYV